MKGISVGLRKLINYFLKYHNNVQHKEPDGCSPCPPECKYQEFRLSKGIDVDLNPKEDFYREISLTRNPYKECCTLSGMVKDKHGCPIENALVQVFDAKHHPITHMFTNEEGQYMFCLAPGNYILKAVR